MTWANTHSHKSWWLCLYTQWPTQVCTVVSRQIESDQSCGPKLTILDKAAWWFHFSRCFIPTSLLCMRSIYVKNGEFYDSVKDNLQAVIISTGRAPCPQTMQAFFSLVIRPRLLPQPCSSLLCLQQGRGFEVNLAGSFITIGSNWATGSLCVSR